MSEKVKRNYEPMSSHQFILFCNIFEFQIKSQWCIWFDLIKKKIYIYIKFSTDLYISKPLLKQFVNHQ